MIRALNHVGLSVASLERSVSFYQAGMGMEVVTSGAFSGQRYENIVGLKGASGRAALLRVGDLQLELFEYAYPQPKPGDINRPVCDHGITHFCVEVADIQRAYDQLKRAGARFHCPPLEFPGTGKATYGRDPDGNVFELVELAPESRMALR